MTNKELRDKAHVIMHETFGDVNVLAGQMEREMHDSKSKSLLDRVELALTQVRNEAIEEARVVADSVTRITNMGTTDFINGLAEGYNRAKEEIAQAIEALKEGGK